MKKNLILFFIFSISSIQLATSTQTVQALTYNEIVREQTGKVLGDSTMVAPTGLQSQCNSAGNQVTLTWNAINNATFYLLRLNDTTNDGNSGTQWGWYNTNTTDISNDRVTQSSLTTTVIPGHYYTWWIHSHNGSVGSDPAYGVGFTCNPSSPAISSPVGLQNQCNAAGNQVTLTWNAVNGADYYLLRVNDPSDDSSASQWGWYNAGTTDISNDHVAQTTYTTPVVPGKNYLWWVHGQAGSVSSNPTYSGFNCTVQQTGQALINVRDYGVRGDGVTDDAPSIQRAIEQASYGSTVYIPAGTYMLGTSAGSPSNFSNGQPMQTALWLKASNVIIRGDGTSTVLQLMPHKKMRIITISGNNDTLDNFTADGNKSQRNGTIGYPDGDVVDGLIVGEAYRNHLIVQNCEVRDGIEDGIGFWQNSYALVQNCYSHDNGTLQAGATGISLSGGFSNKAINNRLVGNTYGAWSSFGSNGTEFRNNTIQNSDRSGLALGGSATDGSDKNFIVDGNTISGSGWAAVGIGYVLGGSLTNNQVINNTYDGIQIYDTVAGSNSSDWNFQNNVCSNNGTANTQGYGIRIIGAARNIIIRNNTCQNNGRSLADQIVVDPQAQVNSDWRTVNTMSFGSASTSTPPLIICEYAAPPIGCTYVQGPSFNSTTQCGNILSCPSSPATSTPAVSLPLNTSPYPSGSLVNDSGTIYFINGTTKIPFTNWQAFVGLGYSLQNVTNDDLSAYTPSSSYMITTASADHPWGSWLLYNGTVYYSHENGLIGVPSAEIFLQNGGDWKYVVKANKYDIEKLGANPNLPVLNFDDSRVNK